MSRWARWSILVVVTGVGLALTVALLYGSALQGVAASPESTTTPSAAQYTRDAITLAALEPDLVRALAEATPDARLNVIVELREQVSPGTIVRDAESGLSARMRLVGAMQATAQRSQADVRAYLSTRWKTGDLTGVTPFWIFNGLAVRGARPDIVRQLASHPDVALIRLDRWRRWIAHVPTFTISNTQPTWGVERIRADVVWSSLGVSGTGVVVANMDTGVDWQHPALHASYRGYNLKGFHRHEGNWHDATDEQTLYPVDGNGHGSHTMGTLVGRGGIGVAPGARWIAVRAFDTEGFAFDSWLHAGFEWLLAPDGDPALAPDVINNSWGSSAGTLKTFQRDIDALRGAGIVAFFAAGNIGPGKSTINSPASLPGAFAVGASDQDDEVASFSSRGPSPWGELRPHIVAPGVNVLSTLPGGTYGIKQGTSMATPHAAGTAALMLSARPDLTIIQTAYILTRTATPLTDDIPNNDSGYGRVDAYAAVALAANAGLVRGTVYGDGQTLADATIHARPSIGELEGTTNSDEQGRYRLFLGTGYYDLTVSAFGYVPVSVHAVLVVTGGVTVRDFHLTPLPTGRVQGTVSEAGGGAVEATVRVLGTPVAAVAVGGNYDLELPSGSYTLEARALGYRVVTASVTVAAPQFVQEDFLLTESMRILLLDSGPRYHQSHISYYHQALDDLAYAYDSLRIKHLPDDTPTVTDLLSYDLVIWSAPQDSPGLVDAGSVITEYLGSGGNLLLSGQDVAFWDGGGGWALEKYYVDYLHSNFWSDDAPSRQVVCSEGGAFDGVSMTIQGGDGADNQRWPDEIAVHQPDHAALACNYVGGEGAVIQVGSCRPYRALNLGFGFEGINNATDRAQFMGRALDWFASPRPTEAIELSRKTDPLQVGRPGAAVIHAFRVRNLGEAGKDAGVEIEISGNQWRTTVLPRAAELAPCEDALFRVRVRVPTGATWNTWDAVTLTARSTVSPAVSETLVFTTKTPAPVLLVDDDRWFDVEEAYEEALVAANVPYDRWEVDEIFGEGSPPAHVLHWYPQVLWFTGYDWFDPLHPSEVDRLTGYLEDGGRLFLSSQSALSHIGSSQLVRDYFGVIHISYVLSHTTVQGVPRHPLGDGFGPVDLTYPFNNWSDSVLPASGTEVAFRGQHGQPGAVTREGGCGASCRWRTAFFGFSVEALPQETRAALMSRLVGWLSWLGGADIKSDRSVAEVGDTIAYTLTLRNDGSGAVVGASVSNPLPPDTLLIDGPHGGAYYDPQSRQVKWTGDLSAGAAVTFTYRLRLTGGVAGSALRNVAEIYLTDQGLHFQRWAEVYVEAPDLSTSRLIMTPTAKSAGEVPVTLIVRNSGLADASNVRVDNPLPWPLRLVTGTLSSGNVGTPKELPEENRIQWWGEVTVGAPVTLTYRMVAMSALTQATQLYNAARLDDGLACPSGQCSEGQAWERGAWLKVEPQRYFLPIVAKKG